MIKKKIVSSAKLVSLIRAKKKSCVVFTNGCFDLLHSGHVSYLEKARALGDILIVALNTDASTQRLKGPNRPINALADRAQVIAALESVTYVTWFDEDTPFNLIKKILPDILVKGGDYKPKDMIGYESVIQNGGAVKVLPYVEGKSTTQIISKAALKKF